MCFKIVLKLNNPAFYPNTDPDPTILGDKDPDPVLIKQRLNITMLDPDLGGKLIDDLAKILGKDNIVVK